MNFIDNSPQNVFVLKSTKINFHLKTRISFSCQNAQLTEGTNEFSATDQLDIVGAYMKTPESQFLEAAPRINSRSAILMSQLEQCLVVPRKMNS
jgi:hypothetical protein